MHINWVICILIKLPVYQLNYLHVKYIICILIRSIKLIAAINLIGSMNSSTSGSYPRCITTNLKILNQTKIYSASIPADLDSLAEILISLKFFQTLFMFSLSLKFSRAGNLSEILIWYCFLTSSSFSFLRLYISSNLCCLFTYCQYFPNVCIHHIVISITVSYPEIVHRVFANDISYLSICEQLNCVFPSGEVHVYL